MTIEINRKIEFTDGDYATLLEMAFEGAIASWCRKAEVVRPADDAKVEAFLAEFGRDFDGRFKRFLAPVLGGVVSLKADDEDEPLLLTREKLEAGLKLVLEHPDYAWIAAGPDCDILCNMDDYAVSAVIECALWGEVVYC